MTENLPGGKYARVHLGWIGEGLSADTLAQIFKLSAKPEANGAAELEEKLTVATQLVQEGVFPFDEATFLAQAEPWQAAGYPAIHHSEAFRAAYKPAYRVVDAKFVPYLPLLAKIDTHLAKGNLCLAVEGGSASGKTTLADMLHKIYGCAVIHTDDFFLQPHQRTAERYSQAGGNLDRERLLEEVLAPLAAGKAVRYRRFDCGTMTLGHWEDLPDTPLTVIEGAYSMHPALADFYDLSVFLEVSKEMQERRLAQRNSPAMAQRYLNEWIPMEKRYFDVYDIKRRCDLVL
jgi:uridine kinase